MQAALERGRWTFQAPLGYQKDGLARKGALVRDPVRAPLVTLAFERYATGRCDKNAVLRTVTALGLTTAAGRALSPQTFGALLRNPIYAGWIRVWADHPLRVPHGARRAARRPDGRPPGGRVRSGH
jgi:hypothetical protein